MYIKSVIIDGFKSYGRRTEINGFDPEFTAITGLNGTGKSNILDSICFVLGINNLTHVRANSLQDLVYKSGQAGVTKATVTLIFDNSDPNQCPLGYEKCREISVARQVVVGGKNKYLINGKLVQNKKVVDFFCSVQLNVNNPNFLIMQGRITKVLNMKPQEILSIIEEAAGTSLYESKREATTKLIEKKEGRVRETNALLQEEVEPKLDKLRQERSAYLEWQKINRDIEYLTRIHISSRYLKYREAVKLMETNVDKINNHIVTQRSTIIHNDEEYAKIEETLKNLQVQVDNEFGGELKVLEEQLASKLTIEAMHSGSRKAAKGTIDQEEKKLIALEKNILDDQQTLKKKQMEISEVEGLFQNLKEADILDAKVYEEAQHRYEAVMQGLTTNEHGIALSLQDQLMSFKQQLSEAETSIKTVSMELDHSKNMLNKKENETQTNDAAYINDEYMCRQLKTNINNLEQQLKNVGYENGKFESLEERRSILQHEIRCIKRDLDRQNAYKYEVQYRDPTPTFDRKKVHGIVGKLFDVPDSNNSLALMMTAGGNLYSFVTDDDITSKLILEKGQLQRRVTMIPINKIQSHPIDKSVIECAQNLVGKENVKWALSLIEFNHYFDPVMKFVFGRTLICRDLNVAKKVTYHPNVKCRSVTLDGDIVDPEGTLSGGSMPTGANVIKELGFIKSLEKKIKEKINELRKIENDLKSIEGPAHIYKQIEESLELQNHELKACKSRLAQTTFHQHQEEIAVIKNTIRTLEENLQEAHKRKKVAAIKVKDIEAKLADAKGYHERELNSAAEEMKLAKQKSEQSRNNWKKREQEYQTFQLEINELHKSIDAAHKQREELSENLNNIKLDFEQLHQKHSNVSKEITEIKRSIKDKKEKVNSQNKEIKALIVKKDNIRKQNQELTLEIKKKENEMNKARNDSKDSSKKIDNLEKSYPWILEDRDYFGMKNTRYDYSKEDPIEAGNKLIKMREKKDKMERSLNMSAMAVLDREEEYYQETIRRKKIVEQDKEKIQHIIVKMDEKKREQVDKAWKEVNDNFSSIFSTLLQGAQACLSPVMQSNHLLGLEIKVGFNNVWKESLGELSGGQRSLVALSLILAMLKFSPAPLYILDEVDAALDMAHTQNIGNMLKQHFTSSQFIIVSLKDGMFNNANVLFRTKFEDGVSAVTRTVSTKNIRK